MQIACAIRYSVFFLRHYNENLINCSRFYYFQAIFKFIGHFDFADCLQTQSNQKLRSI